MRSLTHSCPPTLTVNREIAWAASREKREREGRGEAKGGETGRSGRRGEVEPLEQGRRLAKAGPEKQEIGTIRLAPSRQYSVYTATLQSGVHQ